MGKNLIKLVVVALLCFITFGCDQVDPVEEKCVITFDSDGGSEIQSIEIQKGTKISKPNDPVKEGYLFNGWYLNDEKWSFIGYTVTEDMTLKAKWDEKEYTMIFISDNNIISEKKYKFNSPIDVPNDPVKEGYTFIGWDKELPQVMPSEDMTLKAKWEEKEYTVMFISDNNLISEKKHKFNSPIEVPNDPVKEGYDFIRWDIDINETMPAKDLFVRAIFKIKKYTITFMDEDDVLFVMDYDYNTIPSIPNEPIREDKIFNGWYNNNLLFTFDMPITENIVLKCKWSYNEYDKYPDTIVADSYKIAFVTDIGQLKDKSFNQGTWEGVKKFAFDNNITYKYYQPANGDAATDDDRYNAMKAAVDGGAEIIVCAGFMQGNALAKAAAKFTNVKFVFIDGWTLELANVTAIIFREEQGGYLAGYAAVKEGFTKLGFSGGGGGTNPACQRFGYGYIQGANDAAKELGITVSMKYSWLWGSSFAPSLQLESMLSSWYKTGTEVVLSCGGSMCLSAFSAATNNNGKVIGVDTDQSYESETVITSAMKGLREGAIYALQKFYDGKWYELSDKEIILGVDENSVYLPIDEASWKFTKFTIEEYFNLYSKLINKEIIVDKDVTDAETKQYSNLILDYE